MTSTARRLLSRTLMRLARSPRLKLLGQRTLSRAPRLRGLVLRLMYGGAWRAGEAQPVNDFDGRGEYQKRLLDDLQQRWEREA
ncbi:hypothetical protein [uncultured Halomonas sp.]|uniref:hypothetical protein n=1 Tax=uncultured Halomonas sp. TaxID=173971 RepID=UPI00262FC96A|nr:hypothetical protein [uncultured Halomonas sp.]